MTAPLLLNEEIKKLGVVSLAASLLFTSGFCASWLVGSVDPTYRLARLEASVDGQQRTLGVAVTKLDVAISRLEDVAVRVGEMAAQMREAEQRLSKLELKLTAIDTEMHADEGALEARGLLDRSHRHAPDGE